MYLFVPAGKDPAELPKRVLDRLGPIVYLRPIEVIADTQLIGADPNVVIRNLESRGFHVQGIEISTVSEGGAALGAGLLVASLGGGPVGAAIGAIAGYLLAHAAEEDHNAS